MIVDAGVLREKLQAISLSLRGYGRDVVLGVYASPSSLTLKAGDRKSILVRTSVETEGHDEKWDAFLDLADFLRAVKKFEGPVKLTFAQRKNTNDKEIIVENEQKKISIVTYNFKDDPLGVLQIPHPNILPEPKLKEGEFRIDLSDFMMFLKLVPQSSKVMIGRTSILFYNNDMICLLGTSFPSAPYYVVYPTVFSLFAGDDECKVRFFEDAGSREVKKVVLEGKGGVVEVLPFPVSFFLSIKSAIKELEEKPILTLDQDQSLDIISNLSGLGKNYFVTFSKTDDGFLQVEASRVVFNIVFSLAVKAQIDAPLSIPLEPFLEAFTYTGTQDVSLKLVKLNQVEYVVLDNGVSARVYIRVL